MVDSALVWIGLHMVIVGVSFTRFVQVYVTESEFDYWVFAVAMTFCAGALELGMANSYLPATASLNLMSGLCLIIAIAVVLVPVLKQKLGSSLLTSNPR